MLKNYFTKNFINDDVEFKIVIFKKIVYELKNERLNIEKTNVNDYNEKDLINNKKKIKKIYFNIFNEN